MPAKWPQYAAMVAIVTAASLLNWLLAPWLAFTDEAMIYLLAVVIVSVYYERAVSVTSSILSFLAFDFFFVVPTFNFRFGSVQYLITAIILLVVGIITSTLAARARSEATASAAAALRANEERVRSTLLASLSHDLRTPLAVIAGSASSLRENGSRMSAVERDQLLEAIFERSVRMSAEVSDLLEMTRLHAGSVVLDRQWYPLEELIGAAVERSRAAIDGHPLAVDLPSEVCMVRVDGVLLEKLFVNLIENAGRHTPPDTQIQISATRSAERLLVVVRDNGPGLPAGAEHLVFEMFERAGTSRPSGGSGLGLSICRAIADLHGIALRASNAAGGGAEFTVEFPAGDVTHAALNA